MASKALITGIAGQDGSYLTEFLLGRGYEVHGLVRPGETPRTHRIDHLIADYSGPGSLHIHPGDITDTEAMSRIVGEVQPDEVYNLAAQLSARQSYDDPAHTARVTAVGAINLLEAVHANGLDARFFQAASSEMFGHVREIPQTENTPFHPRSPYGCAKVYAYWQTVNYRESYGMFCCNGILFNHSSPRHGEEFVTRKITRTATRIKEGLADKLTLGNTEAKRDWGFAGEYVQAMWRMLQQRGPEDFVIATGQTHSVQEFAAKAFGVLGLDWQDYVETDPELFRPAETDILLGCADKAKDILNWEPTIKFDELVEMMVQADWELAKAERAEAQ